MISRPAGMLPPVPPGVIEALGGVGFAFAHDRPTVLDGLVFDGRETLFVILE